MQHWDQYRQFFSPFKAYIFVSVISLPMFARGPSQLGEVHPVWGWASQAV